MGANRTNSEQPLHERDLLGRLRWIAEFEKSICEDTDWFDNPRDGNDLSCVQARTAAEAADEVEKLRAKGDALAESALYWTKRFRAPDLEARAREWGSRE